MIIQNSIKEKLIIKIIETIKMVTDVEEIFEILSKLNSQIY